MTNVSRQHQLESRFCSMLELNPVFDGIATERLAALRDASTLLELLEGQQIFNSGDPGHFIYVLLAGVVRVFHTHPSGRELTVKLLSPPCTFGEMEILTGNDYLESTSTMAPTRLLRVPAESFKSFLDANPSCTRRLLEDVCARFCAATEQEKAPFLDVRVRTASLLLSFADMFGVSHTKGVRIAHAITQEQIADSLGVATRSVARAIASLGSEGALVHHKGWWIIQRPDYLEELCDGQRFGLGYKFAPTGGER